MISSWQADNQSVTRVLARHAQARTLGPWSSAVELVNAREAAAEQRRLKMAGKQGGEGGSEGVVTVGGMSVRDWRWWGCGMLIIAQTRSGSELKGRRSWAADEALWHMRQGWQCLVWALLGTGEAFMCLRTCAHTHAHARTHTHTQAHPKKHVHIHKSRHAFTVCRAPSCRACARGCGGAAEEALPGEEGEAEQEAERLLQSIAAWRPKRDPKLGPRPHARVKVRGGVEA